MGIEFIENFATEYLFQTKCYNKKKVLDTISKNVDNENDWFYFKENLQNKRYARSLFPNIMNEDLEYLPELDILFLDNNEIDYEIYNDENL